MSEQKPDHHESIFVDLGHVEFASAECHSPYVPPQDSQHPQQLAADVVAQLAEEKTHRSLANNDHNGLIEPGCSAWGCHENHLLKSNADCHTDAEAEKQ